MKTGLVVALSLAAVVLGGLYLVSTLSNPSLDPAILARDLGISIASLATGIAAPVLHRKFTENPEGTE
ncbi:hypothetical protein [Pyrobaculum neutrophilum]|uniref:Uncharacterized protein n=1 Tax=Pyrobaculum neutrophilum (strain DSM 2338 / JCM 9278 / NBRC 100436 / V24Sta) TaxID=444157 RepID=B1YB80_PYRNV|nr:hypothetical protein [Pyrobaculum neutrophilum]ACB39211.1 conserved hypothetical protein [Pyrobaculum neutrophilum V24Sta]